MQDTITLEKVQKYFDVTRRALEKVQSLNTQKIDTDPIVHDVFDMASRYVADAEHFFEKNDYVNAFAALNYAHGWLDCGARLKIFDVQGDSILFTVDE
ncbi:MAG: DUF357 domain-containing protein [Candidatus Woesearchaeota archaeon]